MFFFNAIKQLSTCSSIRKSNLRINFSSNCICFSFTLDLRPEALGSKISKTFFRLEKKRHPQFFQFLSFTSIWKNFNVWAVRKNLEHRSGKNSTSVFVMKQFTHNSQTTNHKPQLNIQTRSTALSKQVFIPKRGKKKYQQLLYPINLLNQRKSSSGSTRK